MTVSRLRLPGSTSRSRCVGLPVGLLLGQYPECGFGQVARQWNMVHPPGSEEWNAMLAELKTQIRQVEANDYIRAKKFIESLAYESRQQAG